MITVFKGIKYNHVLIFDAEYNEGSLIQFSGVLFRKLQEDIFQIEKSLNIYVKLQEGEINRFIRDFTGITDTFLKENGVPLNEAQELIKDFINVEGELLVASHGLYNDRQTLLSNGVDLYVDQKDRDIMGICTYKAARRLLNREKKLSLLDIAEDSGVFLSNNHNAFDDAWATISVFCLLTKLEEERKNEKILQPNR